jgi:tight adherence protein B
MLVVEILGLSIARLRSNRTRINKRLELLEDDPSGENVLMQLRRDRGLTQTGSFQMPLHSFNRLLVQSGVGMRSTRMLVIMIVAIVAGTMAGLALFRSPVLAVPLGLLVGIGVPLLILRAMRNRRQAKFDEQLPEALDIMVRSMRAGHPISVAMSLVARELPDPIGTEFGMAGDEMTYGLDLETALQNMCARVGQQDLPFVVVAVSIQSKTGGNLAEILTNLSRVIRQRFKLRRKVKSMSAEGRWSAGALTLIPLLVFLAVNFLAPTFYGQVKNDPIIMPVAMITMMLWATGIFIIYRLINFRY